jgi:NADH-quinone oxidoreductase subunit C
MSNQEILEQTALEVLGSKALSSHNPFGLLTIEVPAEGIVETVKSLVEHPALRMGFLTDICAVHYPEDTDREIAVVYHLHSLPNNFRIRLKAFLPISNPAIESMTPLFSAANWMERETYDFYGVQFTGHPDLRRILNVDHMDYFPLRKEYALEDETRDDKDDKFFGR